MKLSRLLVVLIAFAAACGSKGTGADAAPTRPDAAMPDCPPTCFRAVRCVTACGAQPVAIGCCPCAPPAFDDIKCLKR